MKKNLFYTTILPLLFGATLAQAAPAAGTTLEQSFQSALTRNETIGEQLENVVQAEERYNLAIGSVLPQITAVGSFLQQQDVGQSDVSPASQPLLKLMANQALFRGMREYAALRQTKDLKAAAGEGERQARVQLWNDVAASFYLVLSVEKDLFDLTHESQYFDQRIHDLNARVRIGRSRLAEVLTVQSSLAALNAQLEADRGQLAAAREAFAFQTGLPPATPLVDTGVIPALPAVDDYTQSIESRPDVKAAVLAQSASDEGVSIARGARLPSADFTGNYYLKRAGFLDAVHWDVQLGVSIPIYTGGTIDAGVRTAASQLHQSELALNRTRRAADQEIRSLHATYLSDRQQIRALTEARQIAERNYKVETGDYKLGLVTNLDVLQALTAFIEAERALDRAAITAKLDYSRLLNAAARNQLALGDTH